MICNLVLEGGGAKGFAHIGALKAIQEYGIKVNSVAGTSAGAIAALLVACGYQPDEMYDSKTGSGVFPKNLLKILLGTKSDVIRLTLFIIFFLAYVFSVFVYTYDFAINHGKWTLETITLGFVFITITYLISLKIKLVKSFLATLILLLSLLFFFPLLLITLPLFWHFGLITTTGVRNWLIKTIEDSPAITKQSKKINVATLTLADFYRITKIDLKIVATDLTNQKIIAFSGKDDHTKGTTLVDAVVASMCIPILFKCCDIDTEHGTIRYVDGGMLSNFPAWLHRKYVLMDDLCHTIGVSVNSELKPNSDNNIDTPLKYISALVRTVLWGRADIENISVKGLMKVSINTGDVTTLKFNLSIFERNELYCQAFEQTINALEKDYSIFPSKEAKDWLKDITQLFEQFLLEGRYQTSELELRSSLASFIDSDLQIAKLIHTYNMDHALDRHLEFDGEEGLTGLCLTLGIPLCHDTNSSRTFSLSDVNLSKMASRRGTLCGNRQQLLSSDINYIISIPIYCSEELQELNALTLPDNVGFSFFAIDFNVTTKQNMKPRAVLNVDISLHNGSNDQMNAVLFDDVFKNLVSTFAAIGCFKIADLSQFKRGYEIEYM
ncbi:patatin-like phospholipase family protein [Vibrio vulnificus]|uniref:patatin-like phospholipase family protein n=1 Tax=Vibrio vulnificus TaxID=672 RepID=UPI00163CCEEC|nr:patatin-like phospholipase family protein [Vibrio vulnificus]QNE00556.1 patatin-like phospholipase family protein [Vibrio vulnificus]